MTDYENVHLNDEARSARFSEVPFGDLDREDARREKPAPFYGCGFDPFAAAEWEAMLGEAAHGSGGASEEGT